MMGTGMGIGMWVFWGVGIVAVLLIAKLVFAGSSDSSGRPSENPKEILEKRYASGEINQDEYESMKKELEEQNWK